ncbi:DUF559 domain-containing protein [Georgenia sp. MJ206]|uniref:DUF559 domain-containing protein n=1 Tax=Georgenia wangjunii TaxID=3117730 RepID=UPI002F267E29
MYLHDVLDELGGVGKRSELAASAAAKRGLARSLETGEVLDVGGGWLARPGTSPAAISARRLGGTITCESAAAFYGLPTLRPGRATHVALPRNRGTSRRPRSLMVETVIHRESSWTPPVSAGLPLAPLDEALARAVRCLQPRQAIVMVDAGLNRGLLSLDELRRLVAGPRSAPARIALEQCDSGSRSVIETLARLTLKAAGFAVRAAVQIPRVGEVDLLIEECVVVECDGFAYHSGRDEYREDRRRDRELVAQGYVVLRFTYEELMNDPLGVITAVRRAVAACAP